jgi:hypothetical protein
VRYTIVTRRNVGNAPDSVIGNTRRYNGAVSIADAYIDSAYANARKHCPDGRVVQGPIGPDAQAVISLYPDGTTIVDSVHIIPKNQSA